MLKRIGLAAATASLVALLGACGLNGSRPSTEEIRDALRSGNEFGAALGAYNDDTSDCIAEAIHDSDLSDEAVTALIEADTSFSNSESDADATRDVSKDWYACVIDNVD